MHRPLSVETTSWEECARRYVELPSRTPAVVALAELCNHVNQLPLRELVFSATSMLDLLISQHAPIEWNTGVLRISPEPGNHVRFVFHEQNFVEPVTFDCAPDLIVKTFETFLRNHKWVSENALSISRSD